MRTILNKVFRSGKNIGQILFAGFGFMVGLLILLWSVQLYLQINRLLEVRQKFSTYLLLSKPISFTNTLLFNKIEFSQAEIADLKKQPFTAQVGVFTANQFEVLAFAKQAGFYSEMFMEAIDNEFIDDVPAEFRWQPNSDFLPVILSKDMLDLYNFGYSLGKGGNLPPISPSTAKLLTITVRLSGEKRQMTFPTKVVGFSERIPTILVPLDFMQWANKNIGADKKPNPSRILLKVRNASDTRLNDYLKSKGYITNRDRLQASQVGGIIQVVMSALGVIGAFFIALSFVVFLLNFRVILAEAKAEVSLLLQLGYTTGHLAHYLLQYFIVFIGILVVSAIGALYYVVGVSHRLLTERGLEVSAAIEPTVWLIAVIFIGLTLVANVWSISRILRKA